ncbi:hypothetical protein CCHR01_00584 [Colletotrichum chrysophilum]|uniref:Uncharacterized protein n=1 Tax=Colletotrichum chrysophilum TaxID=1836956 RepID=A0AAD9AYJ3_9PEZI|nr:hypothetical protein CCHR01_00584 [Colletotrichum chrysophilum]
MRFGLEDLSGRDLFEVFPFSSNDITTSTFLLSANSPDDHIWKAYVHSAVGSLAAAVSASIVSVFARPISSAKIPPRKSFGGFLDVFPFPAEVPSLLSIKEKSKALLLSWLRSFFELFVIPEFVEQSITMVVAAGYRQIGIGVERRGQDYIVVQK